MAVLRDDIRSAIVDTFTSYLDEIAATPGEISISSATDVLVALTFSSDAFAAADTGVAESNAINIGTVDTAGVAATARLLDGEGNDVLTGLTVGLSGSNINMTNINLSIGDKVEIGLGDMTITYPAS
jgi:hypothetical protein